MITTIRLINSSTTHIVRVCIWIYILIFTSIFYIFVCFLVTNYHPFVSAQRTSFSISCKASLVVMNSLSFCLSGSLYLSLILLRTVLPDIVFLVSWGFFFFSFPALWIYHPTPLWPASVLLRNPLAVLWGRLCMRWVDFSCCFHSSIFDSWQSDYNVTQCGLLWFIFYRICSVSWIWMPIFLPRFGKFLSLFL